MPGVQGPCRAGNQINGPVDHLNAADLPTSYKKGRRCAPPDSITDRLSAVDVLAIPIRAQQLEIEWSGLLFEFLQTCRRELHINQ